MKADNKSKRKKRANSYWKVARLVGWMGKSSSFLSPDSSFRRPSFSTLIFFSIFVRFYSIRGPQDDRSWSGSGFPFSGGNFHPVCAARKWHRIWRGEWSDVYKTLARAVAYYTPLYPPSIPFLLGGTRIYYPHVIPVNHSFVSSPVYASSWATDVGWWTIAVPMKEFSLGSRRQQRKKKTTNNDQIAEEGSTTACVPYGKKETTRHHGDHHKISSMQQGRECVAMTDGR